MNGALKAAWGLTAFVVLAGIVGWAVTGRAAFAVQALFAYLVLALWAGWVDKPDSQQLFDERAGVLR